jgi:hypothetical protein
LEDQEINIDIQSTVDDLLKCWNSRIQYQNYMRQIDAMVLGIDREPEIIRKENQYIEGPDIRFRNTIADNKETVSKGQKSYEQNLFRSSLQRKKVTSDNPIDPLLTKRLDYSSSLAKLNDVMSHKNDEMMSNNSFDSNDVGDDAPWNDKSNRNNLISNKKVETSYNKRYSEMSIK